MPLIDFVDWMGSCRERELFFVFSLVWLCLFCAHCICLAYSSAFFSFAIYIHLFLPINKRKKTRNLFILIFLKVIVTSIGLC